MSHATQGSSHPSDVHWLAGPLVPLCTLHAPLHTLRYPAQALLVLVSCATKYPGLNMILQDMLVPLLPFARDAAGNFRPPLHWVTHALRVALFGELAGAWSQLPVQVLRVAERDCM